MLSPAQSESIVEAGILAPSADNRHLLRFQIGDGAIVIRGAVRSSKVPRSIAGCWHSFPWAR